MLKFTKKTEYALIALRHLQLTGNDVLTNAREIAEEYSIPLPLLAKILQELAKKEILRPVQGARGGYKLAVNLSDISMTDFIEMLEGPIGMVDCSVDLDCDLLKTCCIKLPIQRINENIRGLFDKMTLYDVTH
ncbi:MAG: RrF2 family transcriptional regulator [Fidelibacterota bacterium]